jgi:hypothetical protein
MSVTVALAAASAAAPAAAASAAATAAAIAAASAAAAKTSASLRLQLPAQRTLLMPEPAGLHVSQGLTRRTSCRLTIWSSCPKDD